MKPHWVEEGGIYYGRVAGRHPQGPCHFNVLISYFPFLCHLHQTLYYLFQRFENNMISKTRMWYDFIFRICCVGFR